jgi:hypothetical protein
VICDVSDSDFVQRWWPCKLFDATGSEIFGCCVWADTDTGEVVRAAIGETEVDHRGEVTMRKRWATYPAPLRLERMRA